MDKLSCKACRNNWETEYARSGICVQDEDDGPLIHSECGSGVDSTTCIICNPTCTETPHVKTNFFEPPAAAPNAGAAEIVAARCLLCNQIFYQGPKVDYSFFEPFVPGENAQRRRFQKLGRGHCAMAHSADYIWNFAYSKTRKKGLESKKCTEEQVDELICRALSKGTELYPLVPTNDAGGYGHTHLAAGMLLLSRVAVARSWLKWYFPRRTITKTNKDQRNERHTTEKVMAKEAQRRLTAISGLFTRHLLSDAYRQRFYKLDPAARLNELQLLSHEVGRYKRCKLFADEL